MSTKPDCPICGIRIHGGCECSPLDYSACIEKLQDELLAIRENLTVTFPRRGRGCDAERVISDLDEDKKDLAYIAREQGNAHVAANLRIAELEDAMRLVLDRHEGGCESFVAPSNCITAGRKRDAKYGADQWCDACVLKSALQETP